MTATFEELFNEVKDKPLTDTAPTGGSGYTPVPESSGLVAQIKEAGVTSKDGGTPALFFKFYFPKYNTEETSYIYLNNNEVAVDIVRKTFSKLGLALSGGTVGALDKTAKRATGYTVSLTKKNKPNQRDPKKPFRNYYIDEVVSTSQTADAPLKPQDTETGDIPW